MSQANRQEDYLATPFHCFVNSKVATTHLNQQLRGRSSYLINVVGNTHLNKKPKLSVCLLGVGHDWGSKRMHVPKHFSVCFPDLNQGSPFLDAQI